MGVLSRQERLALLFLAAALVVGAIADAGRRRALKEQELDPEARAFLERFFELAESERAVVDSLSGETSQVSGEEEEIPRINLNKASVEELQRLPRIGPVTARRILEARRRKGRFNKLEDLLEVKGIGVKTLEALRPYVTVGEGREP